MIADPGHAPGPAERFDLTVDEASFERLVRWRVEHGELFAVRPATRKDTAWVVNRPEHVHRVLVANRDNYAKGVGFERVAMLLGNGLIVTDGARWREQRRTIQPAFHKRVIERLAATMHAANAATLARWRAAALADRSIDLTLDTATLALEVILRCLFGEDLDRLIEAEGTNPFALLVEDSARDLALAMRFRALGRHVTGIARARAEAGRWPDDWLTMLARAGAPGTGEPMGERALVDEVMTIIVAGHETTASTLNWTWWLLAGAPEARARLQAEVDALEGPPGFGDLGALDYARCTVDETLRLYPPVWLFSRKALGEDRLGDHTLAAGSDVFLSPYLMQRDPAHWADPDAFRPERFADPEAAALKRTAWYPFSLGARRCIGEFFATVDMQLHLGLIARELELDRVDPDPPALEPRVNLRCAAPIRMRPRLRRPGARP